MKEISSSNFVKGREQFILDKCRNKNVLHLGCCDEPYTKFVFDKNSSLFQRIEKVCESQLGLDIYREGIDYLHGLGHKNVSFFDLNHPGKVDFKPDVIVFADTLEHLMNLETALTSLKGLMTESVELIITVPNATMFERVLGNFRGKIHEHPDHKVAFTYTALKQLLGYNGFRVTGIFLSDQLHIDGNVEGFEKKSAKDWILIPFKLIKAMIRRILVKLFPLFSECLIAVCKI